MLRVVFINSLKLIVLVLFSYYIMLPSLLLFVLYIHDNLLFIYALIGNYISRLTISSSVSELIEFVRFDYHIGSFLYKNGYLHLWDLMTPGIYTSRMLWDVSVTFWYDWSIPHLFDKNYAWRLNFFMLPFSNPNVYYILPYWQNYAQLYHQLGWAYHQFFDAGNGCYTFLNVDKYVSAMSGSYLLIEYRYAWIISYYGLYKPALVFGNISPVLGLINDLYKTGISVDISLPDFVQFKIFQFVIIIWIFYRFLLNNSYFNNYFKVFIPFTYVKEVYGQILFFLVFGFFLVCIVIFFCGLLFNIYLDIISVELLSCLCVFIFALCFLVRGVALNQFTDWIIQLDVNQYVVDDNVFNKNIIVVLIIKFVTRVKKYIKQFYKEWLDELESLRSHDRVVQGWFKLFRYIRKNVRFLIRSFRNETIISKHNKEGSFSTLGVINLRSYYLYILSVWFFLLTHIILINQYGMFSVKFVSDKSDYNAELKYILQGEHNQIFYLSCSPVKYAEMFIPVSLKVSRGGVWLRSSSREISPLVYFRNKDLLRYLNSADDQKYMLWDPNSTYITLRLGAHYYKRNFYERAWSKLVKRVGVLYSTSLTSRKIASLVTFYEYYARVLSVYTMPVFEQLLLIVLYARIKIYVINLIRAFRGISIPFFSFIISVWRRYKAEVVALRNHPSSVFASKAEVIFKISVYRDWNLNNRVVENYWHDKRISQYSWLKIRRVFRVSLLGSIIFGGLSIQIVSYVFVLMSMKLAFVLFRVYERFIVDYLLYFVLSLLYKVWFFSKIFDVLENLNTPFLEKNLRQRYRKRHLTNPTFVRERLVCSRYYRYGQRSWKQAMRGKALFFHKQPNAFDWNVYL